MSASGQKQTSQHILGADIRRVLLDVAFVGSQALARSSYLKSGRRRTAALCLSNGLADALWRYGRSIELEFERTERVRDSVRKGSRWPNWFTFADALHAERIERRW